ncbi:hypothetical protein JMN32_20805 [Fulvivirga sp. 29W222]|uniref:Uncharacterized protein n=1 Tax=Fulvivirga marina TaxID=2494733 RepID=A0A937FZ34_9BACT|nr:hypothetical protein [Fulvivirga marina]MBL6448765.1 hypothetical protein [Fulvivirga marina]
MEKKKLREQIMSACIEQQQALMDDFSKRIKMLLSEIRELSRKQTDSKPVITQEILEEVDLLNDALIFVQLEMNRLRYLQSVSYMNHQEVELGAIVITNIHTIFISSSIDPFNLNGKKITCISTEDTIFNQMKGKRKGEICFLDQRPYVIRDIF